MKKLITLLLITTSSVGFSHKFFISIADMEYDSSANRINVSLKVIAHDFELMLYRKFDENIELESCADSSKTGLYIQQYLAHNFKLFSADEQLEMKYLGKELNDRDDCYFYFFFPNVINYTTIKIVNRLLFSISDQQQNIVHYKYKETTKSVTLVASKSEAQLIFE